MALATHFHRTVIGSARSDHASAQPTQSPELSGSLTEAHPSAEVNPADRRPLDHFWKWASAELFYNRL